MFVLFLQHSDVSSALVVMLVNYAHTSSKLSGGDSVCLTVLKCNYSPNDPWKFKHRFCCCCCLSVFCSFHTESNIGFYVVVFQSSVPLTLKTA